MNQYSIIAILLLTLPCVLAKPLAPNGFVESQQPFLRSALIVSEKPLNRVRRGVLLPLGNDLWTCFDPDLLRYAAIWKAPAGEAPLTMDSMAGISYPNGTAKANKPPSLRGTIISQTPELPGAGVRKLSGEDIREGELLDKGGKVGPLPPASGRYLGIVLSGKQPILEYRVGQRFVREMNRSLGPELIERTILVLPGADPLAFTIDEARATKSVMNGTKANLTFSKGGMRNIEIEATSGFLMSDSEERGATLLIPPGTQECLVRILRSTKAIEGSEDLKPQPEFLPAIPPFPGEFEITSALPVNGGQAIGTRQLPFPEDNPWKRAIRPTDIAFMENGDALITTLDGDVWRVKDIGGKTATWSRAAFGIFEAMSIDIDAKRGVFVLGRDQITRLDDIDGDGFFDVYACASDAFNQTLHSRDYATSLEVYDDGSFLIGRSGLVDAGKSKYGEVSPDRGSILRIGANGLGVTTLADGLRVPYIGIGNGGDIYASDQQGNFIPSTPIHRIEAGSPPLASAGETAPYLGYEPANFRKLKQPVPPLLWFPYQINRSGASFATVSKTAFPSLGDALVHLSWGGRIFPVETPETGVPFAWKLPYDFDFPILGAATNPVNGKLYATGIGISGYKVQTTKDAGLAEISQISPIAAPAMLEVSERGIVVGFRDPLPPGLGLDDPSPELDLWDIKRTKKYGSGHFRWDGTPGEHAVPTGKLTLSADRRKLSIDVPTIFRSEILRLRLHFSNVNEGREGYMIEIYAKPDNLRQTSADDLADVAKREKKAEIALVPGDSKTGKALFVNYGCVGCHSLDGAKLTGPPLNGIATRYKGDLDAYLKTSIIEPTAFITEGYEPSMPSFAGVIPEQNITHIVEYLKSLK